MDVKQQASVLEVRLVVRVPVAHYASIRYRIPTRETAKVLIVFHAIFDMPTTHSAAAARNGRSDVRRTSIWGCNRRRLVTVNWSSVALVPRCGIQFTFATLYNRSSPAVIAEEERFGVI
ncbi:hypothetical protein EVAR_31573_1 [Eumeta japonica]|uniref:Uncharacterized protein n=1 Tax=Eumeta variegata TaxID=151549 RepID=A0A4C1V9X9_EUMVA|nr:hypothetical protein EVAR_31573_1 [Eumeta japonica]